MKKNEKKLLLGYTLLAVLLALDFIIFYKFVFVTGNVALSINLANDHSSRYKMAGFIFSIFVLIYLVYHYFFKK